MLVLQILSVVLGTGISSAFLPEVAKKIAHVVRKLWAQNPEINEKLQKLGRTLLKIQSHVDDAENKLSMSKAYQTIIEDFKNVLFDAEDLLDETILGYERLNLQHMMQDKSQKQAIKAFERKLGPKIDEMQKKVLVLESEMEGYMMISELSQPRPSRTLAVPQMSSSLVDVSSVIGRENDKQQMIKLVFEQRKKAGVSVIPIVGMVGIGKTTLAQLVFNDPDVVKEFTQTRMWWVSVSFDDDVLKITKSICESTPDTSVAHLSCLNSIQIKLKEIVGKEEKFLLVLDAMCNENPINWDALKLPFQSAAPGSVIVVTTRSRIVSSIVTDSSAYCLDVLPEKDCWEIIKQSLRTSLNEDDKDFEENGLEIGKKCKGLPLVAKVIGSVLRLKLKEMEWNAVLECELWDLEEDENQIYPVLKLGYDHLPAYLKRCFAYCSLFPHSRPFQRDDMIQLWAAEGFIQPRGARRIEDIGRDYFNDFCSRSFFQVSSSNQGEQKYEMHGFIHDLARLVSINLCFSCKDPLSCVLPISTDVRYLSLVCNEKFTSGMLDKFYLYKKLRTFMLLPEYRHNLTNVPRDFFTKFPCLRVLNLSGSGISELSENVSKLILLRYLNLSGTSIQKLPQSIDQIYGLERLNVNKCFRLQELPDNLNKLINLRHIDFDRDISIPAGIGKLTSLETLSVFLVGSEGGKKIQELKDMRHLRGSICIKQLHNVANVEEAKAAMLHEKQYLDELELQWKPGRPGTVDDQKVLEGLEPHYELKKLQVKGYCGSRFPNWMRNPSFRKLVKMNLKMCTSCIFLPSLGKLPFLKHLFIEDMKNLAVVNYEFCEVGGFPSLETLKFGKLDKWKSWQGLYADSMPRLEVLTIETCPEFLTLPSLHYLASLQKLEINGCPRLKSFPNEGLPRSLQCLIISESNFLKYKYCIEDWDMISWIPQIEIDDERIQEEGRDIYSGTLHHTVNKCPS